MRRNVELILFFFWLLELTILHMIGEDILLLITFNGAIIFQETASLNKLRLSIIYLIRQEK